MRIGWQQTTWVVLVPPLPTYQVLRKSVVAFSLESEDLPFDVDEKPTSVHTSVHSTDSITNEKWSVLLAQLAAHKKLFQIVFFLGGGGLGVKKVSLHYRPEISDLLLSHALYMCLASTAIWYVYYCTSLHPGMEVICLPSVVCFLKETKYPKCEPHNQIAVDASDMYWVPQKVGLTNVLKKHGIFFNNLNATTFSYHLPKKQVYLIT